MDIPALILQNRIIHTTRNLFERISFEACLKDREIAVFALSCFCRRELEELGCFDCPRALSGGSFMARDEGIVIAAKSNAKVRKEFTRFPSYNRRKTGAMTLLIKSAPKPNPIITMPVASPFFSGNHLETVATGVTYPSPSPVPPIILYPIYNKAKDLSESAKAAKRYPRLKRTLPISAILWGPAFGSITPPTAAAMPRKNIANEKTRET